jgi:FkbH-like protein
LPAARGAVGAAVRGLARYALGENQLHALAGAIEAARTRGDSLSPLEPVTLGVVGNATLEHLVPLLVGSAARHGIALTCVAAEFGQTIQEALSSGSLVNRANPDAVLLALDFRGLPLDREPLAFLNAVRAGFREHAGAPCIVQTLAPPPETLFGHLDALIPDTMRARCTAFNRALVETIGGSGDVLFDVAALAETVGLGRWHSPKEWNLAKLPFDNRFLPLYADHVGRLLGALRGKSRRCLVLDLDHTLWGGAVGDAGPGGITLGQGDATGEAFLAVQALALALRERGVLLAVSSKNDDAIARAPFREHPDMLLREDHIAVFQANWDDKARNLRAIAAELELGLDALVFVDDNPAERELVRRELPDVAVPELPDDPALFPRTIAAAGYFESIAFSAEDRLRAGYYQAGARRVMLRERSGDLTAYLASLEMRITFAPFDAAGRNRIAQLINKSNQFNLTTRRYSAVDVAGLEDDPQVATLQVRLIDRFGDHGMISVVICRVRDRDWEIDTWLMSCRVLGRGVEAMVLRELVLLARARGIHRLRGRYLPTERNALVREHYRKLGFTLTETGAGGVTSWELATEAALPEATMDVDRSAFDALSAPARGAR